MDPIPETVKSSRTDVVEIWDKAVEKYNDEHRDTDGFTIKSNLDLNAAYILDIGEEKNKELEKLKKDRHSGGKVDRIRTWVSKIIYGAQGALEPIGGIVGCAYPPATAIAQALLFVLKACKKISDKLDEILKFYETVHFFFERLSLLEGRLPSEHVFGEQLIRVFTVILAILSAAKKVISTGRLLLFAKELVGMSDGLQEAYEKYKLQMNDLESSVLMLTLGTTTETHKVATNMERILVGMKLQMDYFSSTVVRDQFGETRGNVQRSGLGGQTAQLDSGNRNFNLFQHVLKWLSTGAELPQRQLLNVLERRRIPMICNWPETDEYLNKMIARVTGMQCLLIRGKSGMGKSMLAYHMFRLLEREYQSNSSTFVVYFSFSDESGNIYSTKDMLRICARQIAEKSEVYREDLMTTINRKCDACPEEKKLWCDRRCCGSLFNAFLNPGEHKEQKILKQQHESKQEGHHEKKYQQVKDSTNKVQTDEKNTKELKRDKPKELILVLDGMDLLEEPEQSDLHTILKMFKKHHQRMVLVTNKPNYFDNYKSLEVKAKGEVFHQDLRVYAESHIQNFSRLWRSSEDHKTQIITRVCERADNFLYVDHAFQRLSARKGKLEDRLNNLPKTTEDMYKDLLQVHSRNPLGTAQLHCLLTWLAWTKPCITFGAAEKLVGLVTEWPELKNMDEKEGFDLEGEIYGKLSEVLVLYANFVNTHDAFKKVADEPDEDQNSLLGLSSQLFQNFYRDEGQTLYSTEPTKNPLQGISSYVLVFRMITSILTMENEKNTVEKELVCLVSRSWLEHLKSINKRMITSILTMRDKITVEKKLDFFVSRSWPKQIKDKKIMEDVKAAIQTLERGRKRDILERDSQLIAECLLKIFESPSALNRLGREVDAESSSRIKEFIKGAFGTLHKYVELCKGLSIAEDFVKEVSISEENICVYIAKKYISAWWTARYPIEAYKNFRLAHCALLGAKKLDSKLTVVQEFDTGKEETEKEEQYIQFIEVSKASGEWDKGMKIERARQYKCRAMALRYHQLYAAALSDIEEGLKVLDTKDDSNTSRMETEERFELNDRKARIWFGFSEDARERAIAEMENKRKKINLPSNLEEPDPRKLNEALYAFKEALKCKQGIRENDQNWKEKTNMTYQLKAKVEALLHKAEECLESVDVATRTADNVTPAGQVDVRKSGRQTTLIYFNEIAIAMKTSGWENVVKLLKKVPTHQLALGCMDETHEVLHQAIIEAVNKGETRQTTSGNNEVEQLLGSMYEEAVKTLQNDYRPLPSNPTRVWWAVFKRHVCKDLEEAKKILHEALQPVVNGDIEAITPASWQLAEILLNEFWNKNCETSDVKNVLIERQAVYEKMKELVETVKIQVPHFQPELAQISIPLAMMHRELGSLATFKNHTDDIFDACREALTDNLALNDGPSFQMLAKLLALIPDLEEQAAVAFSCQFYVFDAEQRQREITAEFSSDSVANKRSANHGSRGQSVRQEIIRKLPAELSSYSVASKRSANHGSRGQSVRQEIIRKPATTASGDESICHVECGGKCSVILNKNSLPEKEAFLCYYCTNTILCGSCHIKWQNRKQEQGPHPWGIVCKSFHRHVKAPAKSWLELESKFFGKNRSKEERYRNLKIWLDELKKEWEKQWKLFIETRNESRLPAMGNEIKDQKSTRRRRSHRGPGPKEAV